VRGTDGNAITNMSASSVQRVVVALMALSFLTMAMNGKDAHPPEQL
jgi:hypothetical protein